MEQDGLRERIQARLDNLTKPVGSLGRLEELVVQLGLVWDTEEPWLERPTMVVFAGDHGAALHGVSAYPQQVTAAMVANFAGGGAAINTLCREAGLELVVVDAGVAADLSHLAGVEHGYKLGRGSAFYGEGTALSSDQMEAAFVHGQALAERLHGQGCNLLAVGEMGIGNTAAASCLMAWATGLPASACTGRGTGVDDAGLLRKTGIVEAALALHGPALSPRQALAAYAGPEMALMAGTLHAACGLGMAVLLDGFITCAVWAAVAAERPDFADRAIFAHAGAEYGHRRLLAHLNARPLLELGLRLGEGSGAALALPLLRSALAFYRQMATFDDLARL